MPRSSRNHLQAALLLLVALTVSASGSAQFTAAQLAPTPPMGWNSWDAYGFTISEDDFKANVKVLASIKQYGWQYAVIDEGWYMQDPFAANAEKQKYAYDANGRLIPDPSRFPDSANGAGLKPLADWVHAQGLKFGIHLVRGIPRRDVAANTPIAGSKFTAVDAGDTSDACPWDQGNWGVKDSPAGQAWYDSMVSLYAGWGVDFLKVDCISDHPYKPTEIRMIAEAIKKTGRPIVLSLSPGPTSLENAAYVAKYSQMWRIADDHWDVWSHDPKLDAKPGPTEFPFGTRQAFDRLAAWQPYVKPGSWPDEDMLPIGSLTPHPGWGQPRESRLTHDEERTEFTLWAIARSPLILGGNLTKMDDFLKGLITDKTLIEMDQESVENHPVTNLPGGFEGVRVWEAKSTREGCGGCMFLAIFNLNDKPVQLKFEWIQLGLRPGREGPKGATLSLPAHGSITYSDLIKLPYPR